MKHFIILIKEERRVTLVLCPSLVNCCNSPALCMYGLMKSVIVTTKADLIFVGYSNLFPWWDYFDNIKNILEAISI